MWTKTKPQKEEKVENRVLSHILFIECALQVNNAICIEKFSDFPQLGRFTLRTEGDKGLHYFPEYYPVFVYAVQ